MPNPRIAVLLGAAALVISSPVYSQAQFAASDETALRIDQAQHLLQRFQQQVTAKQTTSTQSTLPEDCLPAPLPSEPRGPSDSAEIELSSGSTYRVSLWREPCGANESVALIKLAPTGGKPSVNPSLVLLQDGRQFPFARVHVNTLSSNPVTPAVGTDVPPGFISPLRGALVNALVTSEGTGFDWEAPFSVIANDIQSIQGDQRLDMPAFSASDFPGANPGAGKIGGEASGAWLNRDRDGEGFLVEAADVGGTPFLFVTWFTYRSGEQLWLVGAAPFERGTDTVEVPLQQTSGADFGQAFNPDDVQREPWGGVVFEFQSCARATARYSSDAGQQGEIALERFSSGLLDIGCRAND